MKKILTLCLLGVFGVIPLAAGQLFSDFYLALLLRVFIFGILMLGFDLLAGYGGLVSFGHAMFFGTGAYVSGLTWKYLSTSVWLGILTSLGANAIVGYLFGFLCIRTRAVYFVFLTFAFSQFFMVTANSWQLVGGSDGIPGVPPPILFPGVSLGSRVTLYYFCLICLAFAYWTANRIINSYFGRVLVSIRDNEERSKFLGYDTSSIYRKAFLISGLFASLAGTLMVSLQPYASPSYFHWSLSGEFVVMEILGGMGTLFGPLLGTGLVIFMGDMLSTWFKDSWMLFLGALYVLCVLFSPGGIARIFKTISVSAVFGWILSRRKSNICC